MILLNAVPAARGFGENGLTAETRRALGAYRLPVAEVAIGGRSAASGVLHRIQDVSTALSRYDRTIASDPNFVQCHASPCRNPSAARSGSHQRDRLYGVTNSRSRFGDSGYQAFLAAIRTYQ
jgi:hypothetical protein